MFLVVKKILQLYLSTNWGRVVSVVHNEDAITLALAITILIFGVCGKTNWKYFGQGNCVTLSIKIMQKPIKVLAKKIVFGKELKP